MKKDIVNLNIFAINTSEVVKEKVILRRQPPMSHSVYVLVEIVKQIDAYREVEMEYLNKYEDLLC